METLLKLSIAGFPPLSARGCVQELNPIQSTAFRRTLDGALVALNAKTQTKYQSIIHCEDKTALATEGLNPGVVVDVSCLQRLWQRIPSGTQRIQIEKKYVPESVDVLVDDQEKHAFEFDDDGVILQKPAEQECYLTYRPVLRMMVKDFTLTTNEWGMVAGWRLNLEEV